MSVTVVAARTPIALCVSEISKTEIARLRRLRATRPKNIATGTKDRSSQTDKPASTRDKGIVITSALNETVIESVCENACYI